MKRIELLVLLGCVAMQSSALGQLGRVGRLEPDETAEYRDADETSAARPTLGDSLDSGSLDSGFDSDGAVSGGFANEEANAQTPIAAEDGVEQALVKFDSELDEILPESTVTIDYPNEELSVARSGYATQSYAVNTGNGTQTVERRVPTYLATQVQLGMPWKDLVKLDLGIDQLRSAVLQITARRHPILIKKLSEAEEKVDQERMLEALRENYQAHYAIETWWRQQKLQKLEEQMNELKSQIDQRDSSQAKYVDAAITIAGLFRDGVSAPPPVPTAGKAQRGALAPVASNYSGSSYAPPQRTASPRRNPSSQFANPTTGSLPPATDPLPYGTSRFGSSTEAQSPYYGSEDVQRSANSTQPAPRPSEPSFNTPPARNLREGAADAPVRTYGGTR